MLPKRTMFSAAVTVCAFVFAAYKADLHDMLTYLLDYAIMIMS